MSKRYPDLIVENYVESASGNMLDLKIEFEELPDGHIGIKNTCESDKEFAWFDGNIETEEVAAKQWKDLYMNGAKIA